MAQISNLSTSLEDYLEIILQLVQERGEARVKEIAARKSVRMASVTGALKRLAHEDLIKYKARETVTLTESGHELANRILQRHEFITRFLTEILGVSAETASRDACSIEHIISLESLDRLAGFVEFLKACPQAEGNIVERFQNCFDSCGKSAEGGEHPTCWSESCSRNYGEKAVGIFSKNAGALMLSELKPGERARVISVRATQAMRQRLIDMGLLPGVELTMQRVAPFGDPIDVKLKGFHLSLRKLEAGTISVERL